MKLSSHARPVLVQDSSPAVTLERVELGGSNGGDKREAFVQALVHDQPGIIPMVEIEPAFTPLLSVCTELQTPAGYLDNLWLTPDGALVLGECKLMRNPQARREVVVQALDYARAIAGWHYSDLEAAFQKAQHRKGATLWEIVRDQTDLKEPQFIDAVERRLRFGRFMVLILGDGIQEGVEELTRFLQLHAGLHTSLALVDLSIWRTPDGSQLVVPRIPLKTVLVERGIVVVDGDQGARIRPSTSTTAEAVTASEPEFFEQIEQRVPNITGPLREFMSKVTEVGIEPEFQKSLVLRFYPSPDITASAGYIERNGRVWCGDAWYSANRLGRAEVGSTYQKAIADLVGGSIKTYENRLGPTVIGSDGRTPHIQDLLNRADEWVQALSALVQGLQGEATVRSGQ